MSDNKKPSNVTRMMRLFKGYDGAYGTHGVTNKNDEKFGKLEIKKSARTVRNQVTEEIWMNHLNGTAPIGIIPIDDNHKSCWGCIDLDKYDINHGEISKKIKEMGLPLIVCKSKSGGAHIFLFLKEMTLAELLIETLRKIASALGMGDSEIFPKQSQVLTDRGALGSWLNMPYLGGDATTRYAVKDNGLGMTLSEFLNAAEEARSELKDIKIRPRSSGDKKSMPNAPGFDDAPPCLQQMINMGFPEGGRNNGLFAMAVYLKRKYESDWGERLEKINRDHVHPPLSSEEIVSIIKSVGKKDYKYTCKDAPLKNYCNSPLCKTRKFGVGGGGVFPTITSISKLDTDPPVWFVDIDGCQIELNTRQLMNYKDFQQLCVDKLNVIYLHVKHDVWFEMLGEVMQDIDIIDAPVESSISGQFQELLEEFCMNKHAAQTKDELILGKPWFDSENDKHYFRLRDLMQHLEMRKFTIWGRNIVASKLEKLGGHHFFNIKGKGVNVYWVKHTFTAEPEIPLPKSNEPPF